MSRWRKPASMGEVADEVGALWVERLQGEFSVEWVDRDVWLYLNVIDGAGQSVALALSGIAADQIAEAVAAARSSLLEQSMPEDFHCDTFIDLFRGLDD